MIGPTRTESLGNAAALAAITFAAFSAVTSGRQIFASVSTRARYSAAACPLAARVLMTEKATTHSSATLDIDQRPAPAKHREQSRRREHKSERALHEIDVRVRRAKHHLHRDDQRD